MPILAIARRHGLRIIEDCAHAIESTYRGRPAGLIGDAGCFSFYPTKNVATCDGGMVITRDRSLHEQVKVLSLHGMTADAWSRFVGGPSGYEVVAAGFKYNMTDVAAALALPQLESVEENWRRREQLWSLYNERLAGLPLQPPAPTSPESRHAHHLYTPLLMLEDSGHARANHRRARRRKHRRRHSLCSASISSRTTVSDSVSLTPIFLMQRRSASARISLPLSAGMSAQDVEDVVTALTRIFRYYKAAA